MKRVLLILTMVIGCSLLASCEKETILTVNQSSLSFNNSGGSQTVNLIANKVWSASSNQGWCKVSPSSGDGSDNSNFTLSVSCDANTTYDERSCTITVVCEELTSTITVKQAEGKGLIVSQTEYNLTNEAQTISVEVQANVQYTVSIDDACKSWIKQESTKGLSSNTIKFSISKNESYDGREGKITVKQTDGSLSGTVVVKQSQQNGLFVTTSEYNLSNEKHTLTVEVKANVEFDVKSNADWIKYIETKGLKTSQIVLDVAANEDYDGREGTVSVKQKNGNLEGVITIRQEQNYGILVSQSEFSLTNEAQTIDVEVKYNVDFDVVIPDTCKDWISIVRTKGLSSRNYTIAIAKNETYDNREGSITFKQKNGSLSGTVKVNQSQTDGLIAEKTEYIISYEEQQLNIKVASNIEFEVYIDEDCRSWLSRVQTKGLTEETITFQVTKNEGDERTGKIIFKSSTIQETVLIRQRVEGNVVFEDANFKAYCVTNFDKNGDGEISMAEAKDITVIDIDTYNVSSLQGIEDMPNLTELYCRGNNSKGKLTSIDISHNPALTCLWCTNNQLTSLDVRNNKVLRECVFDYNNISSIDVSQNPKLKILYCQFNQLTSIDVSKNASLLSLDFGGNPLKQIDVSHNEELQSLMCSASQLSSLDVSHNPKLILLWCTSNKLSNLDLSNNTELTKLDCYQNQLTTLDVSHNPNLTLLRCEDNQLTSLDVSHNPELTEINCRKNQLTSLDVSKKENLTNLYCSWNQLTSLDVSGDKRLEVLWCENNQLTSLDVSSSLKLRWLNCSENPNLLVIWLKTEQQIETFYYQYDAIICYVDGVVAFDDANFKAYCVANFDTDGDGELSYPEAVVIESIDVYTDNIASIKGIEYMPYLTYVNCYGKDKRGMLTSIDVSRNKALKYLNCYNNNIKVLDVSRHSALMILSCEHNQLTSLDVRGNKSLQQLGCSENLLSTLDVSECTALTEMYCSNNILSSLDVSKNTELTALHCSNNILSNLDVSKNTKLNTLWCFSNRLTSLDVSNNKQLIKLGCDYNKLSSLDVSKNKMLIELNCERNQLSDIDVRNNTALTYLNCGDNQLATLDVSKNTLLERFYCKYTKLTSLDVSNNVKLQALHCTGNPNLKEIWFKTNQTISDFQYDTEVATIKYK